MIQYDVVITAMNTRVDLLNLTTRDMMTYLDQTPTKVVIHEDHKDGAPYDGGKAFDQVLAGFVKDYPQVRWVGVKAPYNRGLGPSVLAALEHTSSEFVFYNQEDLQIVRKVPISKCLHLMKSHGLNHVRFNKRDTLPIKNEDVPAKAWKKVVIRFTDPTIDQELCISDGWYFQCSLWRRDLFLKGAKSVCSATEPKTWFEAKMGRYLDSATAGRINVTEQQERHRKCKTYIWGPVDEKKYVQHAGKHRRTQEQELTRGAEADPTKPVGACGRYFRERDAHEGQGELLTQAAFDALGLAAFKEGPFKNKAEDKAKQAFGWLKDGRFVYCLLGA